MDAESWAKVLFAIIPILNGGLLLKLFKEWAYSEKEMASKINQAKETITERLAESITDLFEAFDTTKPLRGQPPQTTDHAGRYAFTLRKRMSLLFRFETTALLSEAGHTIIVWSVVISLAVLAGGIYALANKDAVWCQLILVVTILLIFVQVLVFLGLRRLKKQVDQVEDLL